MNEHLHRLAAFTSDPSGGNPAGVHLAEYLPDDEQMQAIAAEVGYSETAFLAADPPNQTSTFQVRYFAPMTEVDFCGHATIASGVVLADQFGEGTYTLHTNVGPVEVVTATDGDGMTARLTSVTPRVDGLGTDDLLALLDVFGWSREDLHAEFPPAVGFAGVWHPILVLADRQTLASLDYDYPRLLDLMIDRGWTTIQIAYPRPGGGFDVRDPFPVGGVVEDPATGAAAAAFGAYLRAGGHMELPASVTLIQGEDMGRRSRLTVDIPVGNGGIAVTGHAVPIPEDR